MGKQANKRIYLSPPHMGDQERELLLDAFDSNWIAPLGPHVDAFEREMCETIGCAHAAALSSGTAALHLALVMLDVGKGDDVWCSTLTFAATANVIRYVDAEPVFVDASLSTWTLDPDLFCDELERASQANRLPKAVIAVDLYGQCVDYDPILSACERHGVPLIADAAESLGASYKGKGAGTFGRMGALSFNGNKIITTSGGGMLVSDDEALIEKARFLATQARDAAPHYEHSRVGYNYRLSNLLAAVGRGQLRSLHERVETRRRINDRYREELSKLPGVTFMPEADYGRANHWLTCLTVDASELGVSREAIRTHLNSCNIEARTVWKPMHLQPVFSECRSLGGQVAESLFEDGLCLPSGSSLTEEDQQFVIDELEAAARV
ncbi:MAG: aminotransferase class I/II-fold pyridoxal phosphate-dependent enzyme [Polyangiaceae bacterium]